MRINFTGNYQSKEAEPHPLFLCFLLPSLPHSLSFSLCLHFPTLLSHSSLTAHTDQLTIRPSITLAKQLDKSLHKLEHRSHYLSQPLFLASARKLQSCVQNCRTKETCSLFSTSSTFPWAQQYIRETKERKTERKSHRDCPCSATEAAHGERPATHVLESQLRHRAVTCMQAFSLTCEIELWLKQPNMHAFGTSSKAEILGSLMA